MNNKRRFLVNSAWVTPLIMSVSLPAHAQTSLNCSATHSDIIGVWTFEIEGSNPEMYTLNQGGTGTFSGGNLSWGISYESKSQLFIGDTSRTFEIDFSLATDCSRGTGIIRFSSNGQTTTVTGVKN